MIDSDASRLARGLQQRIAHSDTFVRYYYQTVNERFAALAARAARLGRKPTEAEVRALLREIKGELEQGGGKFIEHGKTPRARDLAYVSSVAVGVML